MATGANHRRELGLGLQSDKRPDEYVELARTAEAAGFDVVSVFHDFGYQPAIVPLTLIAGATKRIRLGPAALNPYTLHPFEIAGQAAALDLVSAGRAFVGIVQGAWLDRLGLSENRPLTALREAVEIVRRVIAGDRSGVAGTRFRLEAGAGLAYAPLRLRIPLMIGTWKPRTAAYAGEVADEVKIGGCANPEMAAVMRGWIGNDDVGVVVGAVTVVDEDGDAARARALDEVAMYLPVVAQHDVTLRLRDGDEPPLDRFVLAGTPEEVARQAESLFAAGVTRIEFGPPQGLTSARGVRLLAERVLPALRTSVPPPAGG
jgi:5,10-methylenetetrahydromethanopterin reductase